MTAPKAGQAEWVQTGIDAGWITEPYCSAHDSHPLTADELAEVRADPECDILDRCTYSVRILE